MEFPSFYLTPQAPMSYGYGTEWLVRLHKPGRKITDEINNEIDKEEGLTLHMELESEDEARYWCRRFLKINNNRFQGYHSYTLLVVSVNLPDKLVTFKLSDLEQGHNSYLDPKTGEVRQYHEPLYDTADF